MDSISVRGNDLQEASPATSQSADEIPIANTLGSSDQERAEQDHTADASAGSGNVFNKYVYPEFAGYDGERYLDSIIQQILPYALWRTWHYSVDYQAPGNECYVGPTRLATRVKPQERKIMLDFQRLEQRGYMRRYAARLPIRQDDGSMKYQAVTVKDYTPLYALAHEYHLWLHSPHYIAPEREHVDLIMAEPELAAWLCQFDNYRRLLICRKPGRKPATTSSQKQPLTAEQVIALHRQATTPPPAASADVLNVNPYFNASVKTDSANRIESTDQETQRIEDSNFSTSLEEGVVAASEAIRKQNPEMMREYEQEHTESNPNKEKMEEMPPARAEGVSASKTSNSQEKAAAVLADVIPPAHWQELHGGGQAGQPKPPRRVKRPIPDHLEAHIKSLSADMGDRPEFWKSNVTRAAKLYFTAKQVYGSKQFTARYFYGLVTQAKSAAQARTNIAHYNEEADRFNRMPYFWQCFETLLGFTDAEFAYARSKEPLYLDGDIKTFVRQYHQERQRDG